MVEDKIPEGDYDAVVRMLLILLCPFSDANIGFLNSKTSEHQYRFLKSFPQEKLLPKHHFLEHYPLVIIRFWPSCCTMDYDVGGKALLP